MSFLTIMFWNISNYSNNTRIQPFPNNSKLLLQVLVAGWPSVGDAIKPLFITINNMSENSSIYLQHPYHVWPDMSNMPYYTVVSRCVLVTQTCEGWVSSTFWHLYCDKTAHLSCSYTGSTMRKESNCSCYESVVTVWSIGTLQAVCCEVVVPEEQPRVTATPGGSSGLRGYKYNQRHGPWEVGYD